MRNPLNNPTDRILRLLSEYDDLKAAYEQAIDELSVHFTAAQLNKLPSVSHTEFEKELQRQGGNYTRLRNSVLAQRSSMTRRRLSRSVERTGSASQSDIPSALPDLSVDEISNMIKDIK